jgi:hypothetical protein
MENSPQIYVLTVNSSSRKALRVWKGANIHALRHCPVKQIGSALMEMQHRLESLQQNKTAVTSSGSYSLNRAR